jgi:hypothetical protein
MGTFLLLWSEEVTSGIDHDRCPPFDCANQRIQSQDLTDTCISERLRTLFRGSSLPLTSLLLSLFCRKGLILGVNWDTGIWVTYVLSSRFLSHYSSLFFTLLLPRLNEVTTRVYRICISERRVHTPFEVPFYHISVFFLFCCADRKY